MGTTLRRERDSSNAPVNNTVDVRDARNTATSRACVREPMRPPQSRSGPQVLTATYCAC